MEAQILDFIEGIEAGTAFKLEDTLRNIEQLVLKLCDDSMASGKTLQPTKELGEFYALQDGHALNLVGRLAVIVRENVLGADIEDDQAVKRAVLLLRTIQGLCLVHRPSRLTFNNSIYLSSIIEAIKLHQPDIQIAAVGALVGIMVRQVEVIRRFEEIGGLKTVCDTFKHRLTSKDVKLAILEFLFFYLIPETRSPSKERTIPRKVTAEKQAKLGKYLSNVEGLVYELEMSKPFGNLDLEW